MTRRWAPPARREWCGGPVTVVRWFDMQENAMANPRWAGEVVLEKPAMALCAARHGPLEDGSWAKLSEDARERLRFEARAVLAAASRFNRA